MDIRVGDTLVMKKPHPCGSVRWLVLRTGADFRLRCAVCGPRGHGPPLQIRAQHKTHRTPRKQLKIARPTFQHPINNAISARIPFFPGAPPREKYFTRSERARTSPWTGARALNGAHRHRAARGGTGPHTRAGPLEGGPLSYLLALRGAYGASQASYFTITFPSPASRPARRSARGGCGTPRPGACPCPQKRRSYARARGTSRTAARCAA